MQTNIMFSILTLFTTLSCSLLYPARLCVQYPISAHVHHDKSSTNHNYRQTQPCHNSETVVYVMYNGVVGEYITGLADVMRLTVRWNGLALP